MTADDMDPVTILYYAAVCGALAAFAARAGGFLPRVALGVIVGLAAAAVLPILRTVLGI
ncbi:MAG: hypothetical protein MUF73_11695 [Rhodobacteraceae bacterium]|nr:hypothetical protein [Paracoccaceae bacterium]